MRSAGNLVLCRELAAEIVERQDGDGGPVRLGPVNARLDYWAPAGQWRG
jgi:hypothetical protein